MLSVISNFSSCGGGTRTRNRSCPVDGDDSPNACGPASPDETEECNSEVACPLPPEWTEWGEWSGCSKSCGGGDTKRERRCVVPSSSRKRRQLNVDDGKGDDKVMA